MSRRLYWRGAIYAAALISGPVSAQSAERSEKQERAQRVLLHAIKRCPGCALDWHQLRLAVTDERSASVVKAALTAHAEPGSDGTDAATEQSLWVDAARGKPDGALAFYDDNVKAHPGDPSYLNTACWARSAHGIDLARAMPICDAAVANGRQPYVLFNRGMAALQLGRFDEALGDFNEALGAKSFRGHFMAANAAYGRGLARIRLGDAGGEKDVQAAMNADPKVTAYFSDLGLRP